MTVPSAAGRRTASTTPAYAHVAYPWQAAVGRRSPYPLRFYAALVAQTLQYGLPARRRGGRHQGVPLPRLLAAHPAGDPPRGRVAGGTELLGGGLPRGRTAALAHRLLAASSMTGAAMRGRR